MDRIDQAYVRQLVSQGFPDQSISANLQGHYPTVNGLSTESVRKWRLRNRILRRTTISNTEVDDQVRWAVNQLGPKSGRRFIKGYLESSGRPSASEVRIGKSLRSNFPADHSQRCAAAGANLNPVPYHADYFGHKLHVDQNEKLARFGVTHVAGIDGYSGLIVGHATMPRKNNVTIYDKLFLEPVTQYGLWDQIVADHGKEFHLLLAYQDSLKAYRLNQTRAPYLQIKSTKNNRIERVWVEVNSRVNYPVKSAFEHMVDQGMIDPGDPTHLFATSLAGCEVTTVGITRLFDARNSRPLKKASRRGVPGATPLELMSRNNQATTIDPALLMTPAAAAQSYRDNGGTITDPACPGVDPLAPDPAQIAIRSGLLSAYRFTADEIYNLVAGGHPAQMQAYVSYIVDVNRQLS